MLPHVGTRSTPRQHHKIAPARHQAHRTEADPSTMRTHTNDVDGTSTPELTHCITASSASVIATQFQRPLSTTNNETRAEPKRTAHRTANAVAIPQPPWLKCRLHTKPTLENPPSTPMTRNDSTATAIATPTISRQTRSESHFRAKSSVVTSTELWEIDLQPSAVSNYKSDTPHRQRATSFESTTVAPRLNHSTPESSANRVPVGTRMLAASQYTAGQQNDSYKPFEARHPCNATRRNVD